VPASKLAQFGRLVGEARGDLGPGLGIEGKGRAGESLGKAGHGAIVAIATGEGQRGATLHGDARNPCTDQKISQAGWKKCRKVTGKMHLRVILPPTRPTEDSR
jgi:hypothetical protein